ncbi:MAG: GIY-YIG nuclease family protein [Candidatus Thermoplasmatota archaeon]|nr:GIY-YIG nuclease family protein [Candidatus Thermoplasmatota archaeon]
MSKMPKGIYTLLTKLDKQQIIGIGKLGKIPFPAGYYAYIGSARNGLESRLARHLKKEKTLHWHIDYFLQKAGIETIVYCETERDMECNIASQLSQQLKPVPHFGCSDCRCISHLYHHKDKNSLSRIIRNSLRKCGLGEGILLENHHNVRGFLQTTKVKCFP